MLVMNIKSLVQAFEHEILHKTANCGSALHLLSAYLNQPGVINQEHKEEVLRRVIAVVDALIEIDKLAQFEEDSQAQAYNENQIG
jgi:hypothetical protein